MKRQWLWGDQLGPHFDTGEPFTIIESRQHFARHRFHRQKAHLLLSAMRHRAFESERGDYVRSNTYGEALGGAEWTSLHPHSRAALALAKRNKVTIAGPSPGFMSSWAEFTAWAESRKRPLLEDWYRTVRRARGILMEGDDPLGGQWNFDAENRKPPPRNSVMLIDRKPWRPVEDEIDAQVRADLDRWESEGIEFRGRDAERSFAVTRQEALEVLEDFVTHRLSLFGPYEDAMMTDDAVLAHSMLSVPLNLGLLSPDEVVARVLQAFDEGSAPLASVEGFVRQIAGWRDYMWHMYWYLGPKYEQMNALGARREIPDWFDQLQAEEVTMGCVRSVVERVRDLGWTHHIERLMVLSNWALQRGWHPSSVDRWFREVFVDAYPWVMVGNVIGMGLFADGGMIATKPYAAGGAYVSRMSNFCKTCVYDPKKRVGPHACPFTAGYWYFLSRNSDALASNHRMGPTLRNMERLPDLEAVVTQEDARGDAAP